MASADQASYMAAVANNNAIVADQNATYAKKAGAAQAEATSLKGAADLGGIKAGLAANNIDVNTGSAKDVEASAREVNQLDTETTMNNALLQAYGYTTTAANDRAQAGLYEIQASDAIPGAALGAAGGLLGGASGTGGLSFLWNNNPSTGNSIISPTGSGGPPINFPGQP